jgi:hypothetical protein
MFFADPKTRAGHSRADLVKTGRRIMQALIDADDPAAGTRLRILADDETWRAMDQTGNTAQFRFIPALSRLGVTDRSAVETDWVDIAWWADSMEQIAPRLSGMIQAIGASNGDPADNPEFMKKRANLAEALGAVTRNTRAAFVGGWGLAVMFALSGGAAEVEMDIAWDGKGKPAPLSKGAA